MPAKDTSVKVHLHPLKLDQLEQPIDHQLAHPNEAAVGEGPDGSTDLMSLPTPIDQMMHPASTGCIASMA